MGVVAFWTMGLHPITGFKKDVGAKKNKPRQYLKELDPKKYMLVHHACKFYDFKTVTFSRWCEKQNINNYIVYYLTNRFYDLEVLKMFLADKPEDVDKPEKKVPDGYVSLAIIAKDFKVIYSTLYCRAVKKNVPKLKINTRVYVLESEILKIIY